MHSNRQTRNTGRSGIPMALGLPMMLMIGAYGAYIMPIMPVSTVFALLAMVLIGGLTLASDRPAPGTYTMPGAAAKEHLYAELEQRRANGEILPFGNWLPLHRVLFEAQQAIFTYKD